MKSLFGSTVEYYTISRKLINPREKVLEGTATFLKFGSDSSEEGGTFSTAIIKLDDGTLKNIYVEMIRFINE